MARAPLTKPRKQASQERSRVLVETLITATARILVREGFDKASTNRIAEKAGVSVGSLYQYFPSKEALVAAVMERHRQEIREVVLRALAEASTLPMEQGIRKLIAAAVEAHRIDPKLHCVLAEQVPHTGQLATMTVANGEGYGVFRAYLETHRNECRGIDLDLAAFVCVTSIEALTHTAVLHHSESFSDQAFQALIDEGTRLVVRYLVAG